MKAHPFLRHVAVISLAVFGACCASPSLVNAAPDKPPARASSGPVLHLDVVDRTVSPDDAQALIGSRRVRGLLLARYGDLEAGERVARAATTLAEGTDYLELREFLRAVGVKTKAGEYRADAVVVNADFAHAMTKLVPDNLRRRWTDAKIEKNRIGSRNVSACATRSRVRFNQPSFRIVPIIRAAPCRSSG